MQSHPRDDETLLLPSQGRKPGNPTSVSRPPVKYRVLDEIARGGMGAVLRVHDPDLDRVLALKVLLTEHLNHPEMHRRFLDEARITSHLQHPGVVPVHDIGLFADDRPFFTMKLVAGRTLSALLRERGTPADDLRRLLGVFEQVCQTMAYVHSRGVIHRDLKPSNVMVGGFGEVQVMDWGVAKVMRPGHRDDRPGGPSTAPVRVNAVLDLTLAGSVVGTPAYMAPEQARGEPLDERADVFGLGGILCEILTGAPTYTAVRGSALVLLGQDRDLNEVHDRLEGCDADRELIDLARACLAERPEDRPADGQAVASRLAGYRAGVDERLRRAELERAAAEARAEVAQARTAAERRARRLLVGLAGACLLLAGLAGAVGWWYADHRQAAENRVESLAAAARQAADRARSLEGEAALDRWREVSALLDQAREAADRDFVADSTRERLSAARQTVRDEVIRLEDDRALLERLHEVRVSREDDFGRRELDEAYSAAFASHGLAFTGVTAADFAARVRARPPAVAAEVVAALDDWAMARLRAGRPEGQWKQPMLLAQEADSDPWRHDLRRRILDTARPVPLAAVDLITPAGGLRVGGLPAMARLGRRRGELIDLAEGADVVRLRPSSIQLLAGQLIREGQATRAERLLRRAVVSRPGDVWLNYDLGRMLERRDPRDALRYLSAARAIRPEVGHALAHVLEDLGRSEEAAAVLDDLVRLRPEYPSHHICLGNLLRTLGRRDEAVRRLEEAIRRGPRLHHGYLLLARELLDHNEQPARARRLAEEAARLSPGLAQVQVTLARALAGTGDPGAEAAFRRALALSPGHEEAMFHLAGLLAGLGRAAEAVSWYDRVVRQRPNDLAARARRGMLLRSVGRPADARADLEMALAADPNAPGLRAELARVLISTGSYTEAIPHLRREVNQGPPSAWGVLALARCLFKAGQPDEAGRWVDRLTDFPADGGLLYDVGTHCLGVGQHGRAIRLLRASLKLAPTYPEAHCNLGHALLRSGRFREAVAAFERGHDLGAKLPSWRYPSDEWVATARQALAVEPRLAGLADGTIEPADEGELYLAAGVCAAKGLHVTRGRIMGRAAAVAPLSRGDRISLAESNAWAGLARCRDAVLLTAAERGEARSAALKALTDEVAGLPAAEAKRWTARLLGSAALAGLRDEADLARLPAPEAAGWRRLWQAVGALGPGR